ncbi:MAG: hypothetical protein ACR2NB_06225 [Solirubrobacteraceae bacterium]
MNRTRAFVAGLLVAAFTPAAAAQAATLTTDSRCYVEGQSLTIAGSGWVPGTRWSVQGASVFDTNVADPLGNWLSTSQRAPIVPRETIKPTTVKLTGTQNGKEVAGASFKVVNFLVRPRAAHGKPTKKTSFGFSGFLPGKRIYVHVRRGSKTYTVRAGRGDRTCGTLRTRLRRLPAVPASRIHFGTYKVFVDNRRKLRHGGRQFRASIRIFKTFR